MAIFAKDSVCSMCGSRGIPISNHLGVSVVYCHDENSFNHLQTPVGYIETPKNFPTMFRSCQVCGFSWTEEPLFITNNTTIVLEG